MVTPAKCRAVFGLLSLALVVWSIGFLYVISFPGATPAMRRAGNKRTFPLSCVDGGCPLVFAADSARQRLDVPVGGASRKTESKRLRETDSVRSESLDSVQLSSRHIVQLPGDVNLTSRRGGGEAAAPVSLRPRARNSEVRIASPDTGHQRWQHVDDGRGAVFSAFYDDRAAPPSVVVVALYEFRTRKQPKPRLWCHLVFANGTETVVAAAARSLIEVLRRLYAVYFIVCPLGGAAVPVEVSIVGAANVTAQRASNRLVVNAYAAETEAEARFGVCVPAFHSRFDETLQLVEAFETWRLLGASRVTVYNGSASAAVDCALRGYERDGFVEIVQFHLRTDGYASNETFVNASGAPWDVHSNAQVAQVNDCLYRNMRRVGMLAFLDVDEVALPLRAPTWRHLLANRTGASFIFRNFFAYGAGAPADVHAAARDWPARAPRLFFARSVRRRADYRPVPWETYRTKFMVAPPHIAQVGIHQAYPSGGVRDVFLDINDAILLHYRKGFADATTPPAGVKTVAEEAMLRFREPLAAAVGARLEKLKRECFA
ncbi:PREDICTED: uncharacterized protein LOC106806119 [Priapulus caudatus]|uniref:Glycosyltransferase family 92 protein n=1 Tax=Priapulus caudatus TaxID=37621 RepID=A0ABM1DU38_PRICU|nr:PREDICTED: uncharacterized protein LOC106806119 [Priapulus caudatus]